MEPGSAPSGRVNYLIGRDPARWRFGLPTYSRIVEHSAWPGVDVIYYGNGGQLEFDLVAAPDANLDAIRFEVIGAVNVSLDTHGDLVLGTAAGRVRLMKPVVYQESNGGRRTLRADYVVTPAKRGTDDGAFFGFRIGARDPNAAVVIDPALNYSTFLGGSARDQAEAVAVDGAGNVFVAGESTSADFPTSAAAVEALCPRCSNLAAGYFSAAFVSEIAPAASGASQLVYSTYLGGANGWGSGASAIALDARGYVYLTGVTSSTDFPATANAAGTKCGGIGDAFVTVLNPAATGPGQMIYSACLGGVMGVSAGTAIALDGNDKVYVAGYTNAADFPTSAGALQRVCPACSHGMIDGFVSEIDPAAGGAAQLVYSTFLGGSGNPQNDYDDGATAIAVAAPGDVYVGGQTVSADFPTTPNAFQPICQSAASASGCGAGFIARLNTAASGAESLRYASYLGGSSGADSVSGLAVGAGGIFVTGATLSADFPVTPTASQPNCGGGCAHGNAFVAELNPAAAGSAQMVYASFLGGSGSAGGGDAGTAIAADAAGAVYVAGVANSPDLPVTPDAYQPRCAACVQSAPAPNAFVAILNPAAGAGALAYSSFLGGSGGLDGATPIGDAATAIALDAVSGGFYVAGSTASANFPVTVNAFEPTCPGCAAQGGGNAFIAGFLPSPSAPLPGDLSYHPTRIEFGVEPVGATSRPRTVTLVNPLNLPAAISSITVSGSEFAESDNCGHQLAANSRCTIAVKFTPAALGHREAMLTISDNARNSPQMIDLAGFGKPSRSGGAFHHHGLRNPRPSAGSK